MASLSHAIDEVAAAPPEGVATVVAVSERDCQLRGRGAPRRASSGPASLITPQVGDLVLWRREGRRAWVEAVLERGHSERRTIRSPRGLTIEALSGRIRLAAKGARLTADAAAAFTSPSVSLRAAKANVSLEQAALSGRSLLQQARALRTRASEVSWLTDVTRQLVDRMYRSVERLEVLRAGAVNWRARATMQLRGPFIDGIAKAFAKIDGKQIHMD